MDQLRDCICVHVDIGAKRDKLLFKFTGDELLSDTYKINEVDGIFYEVEGKVSNALHQQSKSHYTDRLYLKVILSPHKDVQIDSLLNPSSFRIQIKSSKADPFHKIMGWSRISSVHLGP